MLGIGLGLGLGLESEATDRVGMFGVDLEGRRPCGLSLEGPQRDLPVLGRARELRGLERCPLQAAHLVRVRVRVREKG